MYTRDEIIRLESNAYFRKIIRNRTFNKMMLFCERDE